MKAGGGADVWHELDLAQKVSDYIVCVGKIKSGNGPGGEFLRKRAWRSCLEFRAEATGRGTDQVELPQLPGRQRSFVIGGNGSGIPSLPAAAAPEGIPLAGVLHENDLDYPVAEALGAGCFRTAVWK